MKNTAPGPALCFLIQTYDAGTHRHYRYLYRQLEALAQHTALSVFIEEATGRVELPGARRIIRQRLRFPLIKRFEQLALLLAERLRGTRIFYVHYSFSAAILAALVCRLLGGRVYFWYSIKIGQFLEQMCRQWGGGRRARWKRFIYQQRINLTVRSIHRLVTGSEALARYYTQQLPVRREKIVLLPNWVDVAELRQRTLPKRQARQELGLDPERPVVLFVHEVEVGKGALVLGQIAAETIAAVPEAFFLIVGDGLYRPAVEREMAERGLGPDHVRLTGRVPNREIHRYYSAAEVFIMPSRFEAFSRVLLEAMAFGVPFAGTDGGHGCTYAYTSELQRQCLVPAERAEELGSVVVRLLKDPALREELIREGERQVQQFDFPQAIERFLERVVRGT